MLNLPAQALSDVSWSKIWKIRDPERLKMFLWRVAINALPTRDNLMCRMDISDPCWVLCNQEVESTIYLFSRCQVVKALWFVACWGFRLDEIYFSSTSNIIKVILNPPSTLYQSQDLWRVTLNMALTLEEIWHTQNDVLHLKGSANINAACLRINTKFKECSRILSPCEIPYPSKTFVKWTPTLVGTIKLNVDVAISQSNAALVVIAKNKHGAVLKVWAKIIPLCPPPPFFLNLKQSSGLWTLLMGKIGGILQWKAIQKSALTPSWTLQASPCGLSLLGSSTSVSWLSLFPLFFLVGLIEVEMLLLMWQQSMH